MVSTRSSSSRAGSAAPETPAPATPSSPSRAAAAAAKRTSAGRKSLPKSSSSSSSLSAPAVVSASSSSSTPGAGWSHAPDAPTLFWLGVSLPLVIWDTVYVLGRPHTMEHGWLHWPLWAPYKLYGEVDHVYGWKAFHAKSGFTSAQGALNAVETVMYLAYAWAFFASAVDAAPGRRALTGRCGAQAVLIGFSAAVMTLSKTLLYWLNEYYSGFDNIGHNDLFSLIFLWIIPNGAWLVGSTWMIYSLGGDIIRGIEAASHAKDD
ncbi:C6 transcription factor [Cordyceps javanica]|uniref:C6 transcription factor n=1 Tax=Cordyceps javanica TaxID=43265 RepID=A0A545VX95_9HYPO|nr:C6 transcription factor [Cordyceps javanica]TQW06340.1 C6 transcription factor [Cordyceps javanica]